MSDNPSWLSLLSPAALLSSIPPAILFWQWWAGRADKKAEVQRKADLTVLQHREEAIAAERKSLTQGQREQLERTESERDKAVTDRDLERGKRLELERDRDRGWYLARYYYGALNEAFHAATNARGRAEALYQVSGQSGDMRWSVLPVVPQHLEDVE